MKTLVIGIDGAHIGAFDRGWTPYIKGLMDRAHHLPLSEDLYTRGWFKVATGKAGAAVSALYDHPIADGTSDWTLKFGMSEVPSFGTLVKPIWQILSEAGYRVGVMNLPTVYPAPPVKGFFISGGGGGAPVVQSPMEEHCFPRNLCESLKALDYIVDERPNTLLGESRMKSAKDVFQRLIYKNNRRAEAFLELAHAHQVDFGFVVFKSSSVIAELLVLPEVAASQRAAGRPDEKLMKEAENYYREFDSEVKRIIETCSAEEVLFVSDHGSIVPEIAFNPNQALRKLGFQPRASFKSRVTSVVRSAKAIVPYRFRQRLKKHRVIKENWSRLAVSPPEGSLAFSAVLGTWRNGIYVFDKLRFGGPVQVENVPSIAREIVDALNSDKDLIEAGIKARVTLDDESKKLPTYPDITFSMPDNVFMSPLRREVLTNFKLPAGPLGLRPLFEGKQLGVKSTQALAANVYGKWLISSDRTEHDLCSVYEHIVTRYLKGPG